MNLDVIYSLVNAIVMPFWLLMIFAPGLPITKRLMGALWPVALVPVIYAGLLVYAIAGMGAAALDVSLQGIAALLGTPEGALIGWAHFLALDLFAGRWVYLDSRARDVSPWIASPIVFLCLMSGPVGLLLYILLRYVQKARG